MKYVSLDIETTGLGVDGTCQAVQIAMVVEDTTKARDTPVDELPHLNFLIKWPELQGEHFAILEMNFDLIKKAQKEGEPAHIVEYKVQEFLTQHFGDDNKIVVGGKNVAAFDLKFLPATVTERFHHRTLDPGSRFVDWSKDVLPSLGDLLGSDVAHDALQDARDVITVFRRDYAPS